MSKQEDTEIFIKTLNSLRRCLQETQGETITDAQRAGVIQAFSYTVSAARSIFPQQRVEEAVSSGFISAADQEVWLEMIEARNIMAHTYDESQANEIIKCIRSKYIEIFGNLHNKLNKR